LIHYITVWTDSYETHATVYF